MGKNENETFCLGIVALVHFRGSDKNIFYILTVLKILLFQITNKPNVT
jgi:hypothetical protein